MSGTMEDEWVAAKAWNLLSNIAWRRRARVLESLLPFASTPLDADALRIVVTTQRWVRGHLARRVACKLRNQQASLRRRLRTWWMAAHRAATAAHVRALMYKEHCAFILQRAFRRFLAHWTRPRVSALLREVQRLRTKCEQGGKRGRRKFRPLLPHEGTGA